MTDVEEIYSEYVKIFVGANNELKELRDLWIYENRKNTFQSILAEQGLSLIPPHSSN